MSELQPFLNTFRRPLWNCRVTFISPITFSNLTWNDWCDCNSITLWSSTLATHSPLSLCLYQTGENLALLFMLITSRFLRQVEWALSPPFCRVSESCTKWPASRFLSFWGPFTTRGFPMGSLSCEAAGGNRHLARKSLFKSWSVVPLLNGPESKSDIPKQ